MTRVDYVHIAAAVVAFCGLLFPFCDRFMVHIIARVRHHIARPALLVSPFFVVAGVFLACVCVWTQTLQDWVLLLILLTAFISTLAVRGNLGHLSTRTRLITQLPFVMIPPLLGVTIPVTGGSLPVIDAICAMVFISGIINALAVLNFIDGLWSLIVFLIAACIAAVLDLHLHRQIGIGGDPAGVVFALALCGGSLGLFLFRRPTSKPYLADPAATIFGASLAILLIRMWSQVGPQAINPGVFLPVILVLPILLAGIHREHMSLFRRQRLALILIAIGHAPFWIPITSSGQHHMRAALLAIISVMIWSALITQKRALRGWSIRVLAEPIADVLRITVFLTVLNVVGGYVLDLPLLYIIASQAITTCLMITQVTWWRRRLESVGVADVIVFGTREGYHHAARVFDNCADLFGRHQTRRARVGERSKHLRSIVSEHLQEGHTVVILSNALRRDLIGLRSLGDLVFASDCLLLKNNGREHAPLGKTHQFAERCQCIAHRITAAVMLFLLMPAFAVVAILIHYTDDGPVFFKQERLGWNGKRFKVIKFRSMRTDAPKYGVSPTSKHDPRITPIGRFLRRTSLDEIPQLINVMRGEMRLVGPRPEMPFICVHYDARQRLRLEIPPGVTGLWQVSPHRNDPIHDHVEYDLAYRLSRGPIIDCAIVISTLLGGVKTGC